MLVGDLQQDHLLANDRWLGAEPPSEVCRLSNQSANSNVARTHKRRRTPRVVVPIRKHTPTLHTQPTITGDNVYQVFVVVGFRDALSDLEFLDRLFEDLNSTSTITSVNDDRLTSLG